MVGLTVIRPQLTRLLPGPSYWLTCRIYRGALSCLTLAPQVSSNLPDHQRDDEIRKGNMICMLLKSPLNSIVLQ